MSRAPSPTLRFLMVLLSDLIATADEYKPLRSPGEADRADRADFCFGGPHRLLRGGGRGAPAGRGVDARGGPRGGGRRGPEPDRAPRRRGRLDRLAPRL